MIEEGRSWASIASKCRGEVLKDLYVDFNMIEVHHRVAFPLCGRWSAMCNNEKYFGAFNIVHGVGGDGVDER